MEGQGEKPSIQNIREQLGTGSPSTIYRHLKAWRASQSLEERRAARLPTELAAALVVEMERQVAIARADTRSEFYPSLDNLREQVTKLEAQYADAQRKLLDANSRTNALEKQCYEEHQARKDAERALAIIEARNEVAMQALESRDQRITELIEDNALLKRRLAGALEAMSRHKRQLKEKRKETTELQLCQ